MKSRVLQIAWIIRKTNTCTAQGEGIMISSAETQLDKAEAEKKLTLGNRPVTSSNWDNNIRWKEILA